MDAYAVFSGGGVKGAAHAGCLNAAEQRGLRFKGFGGTSAGSIVALLASIGTAAVPGAGVIMLVIILESVGVPTEGIALILGVDRILDMCRTVTNVTGDMTVATIVASSEGQLSPGLVHTS